MMNFVLLTVSFIIALVLAGVIWTVGVFVLMSNAKFMQWVTKHYMKMLEKSVENFEKTLEDLDV